MIVSVDLSERTQLATPAGVFDFGPGAQIRFSCPAGSAVIEAAGIAQSNWVEVFATDRWACLVGLRASELVVADVAEGVLRVVPGLTRLNMSGYDPGGLERVEFHPIDDESIVLECETSVARVSVDGGILWQRVHDDATCRATLLDDEAIWLVCESDQFGFRLSDGSTALR